MNHNLCLASSSRYRVSLLEQFWPYPFVARKPALDEEAAKQNFERRFSGNRLNESYPLLLAQTLAQLKAESLKNHDDLPRWILGCDQLVWFQGQVWGKPGSRQKAYEMLSQFQGKEHWLVTAQVLMDRFDQVEPLIETVIARIQIRPLTPSEIEDYLNWDEPWDCAGAYRMEKRGLWLVERIDCPDWTAIQGLSIIKLRSQWVTAQRKSQ